MLFDYFKFSVDYFWFSLSFWGLSLDSNFEISEGAPAPVFMAAEPALLARSPWHRQWLGTPRVNLDGSAAHRKGAFS